MGRILDFLKDQNLYKDTYIIILSDHGDSFWEHGERSHREYLYDTTIKIPFILKGPPEFKGKTVSFMVRTIDIYPTIFDFLGIPFNDVDGISLKEGLQKDFQLELKAYSETRHEIHPDNFKKLKTNFVCIRTSRWKLVIDLLDNTKQLFDLIKDPKEKKNILLSHLGVARKLEAELADLTKDVSHQPENYMSPDELKAVEEALRKLGYL